MEADGTRVSADRVSIAPGTRGDLDNVFSAISKTDFENLYWAVKSGDVKSSATEEQMIDELRGLVFEIGDKPFWGPTNDRLAAIRDAIEVHRARVALTPPALAALALDKTLATIETEVLARALSENIRNIKYPNSKFYDRATRFFKSHYENVVAILEKSRTIRERLQIIGEMNKPVVEALSKNREIFEFTPSEIQELTSLLASSTNFLADARADIANLYGRDIEPYQPLRAADFRIEDLGKNAHTYESSHKASDLLPIAQSHMDTVERILDTAWNRKNGVSTGVPLALKSDALLQIRNQQYRSETQNWSHRYHDFTMRHAPENSKYRIRIEWVVSVQHSEPKTRHWTRDVPNAEGHTTRTETYSESYFETFVSTYNLTREDELAVRYEEALRGDVNPRSHVGDLPPLPPAEPRGDFADSAMNAIPEVRWFDSEKISSVLSTAATARLAESQFRRDIDESIRTVDSISNNVYQQASRTPSERDNIYATLELEQRRLTENRNDLAHYLQSSAAFIKRQWESDREEDFRERNRLLLDRYDRQLVRVSHLAEQVRRNSPSLILEAKIPSYDDQLSRLKEIHDHGRTSHTPSGVDHASLTPYVRLAAEVAAGLQSTGND